MIIIDRHICNGRSLCVLIGIYITVGRSVFRHWLIYAWRSTFMSKVSYLLSFQFLDVFWSFLYFLDMIRSLMGQFNLFKYFLILCKKKKISVLSPPSLKNFFKKNLKLVNHSFNPKLPFYHLRQRRLAWPSHGAKRLKISRMPLWTCFVAWKVNGGEAG